MNVPTHWTTLGIRLNYHLCKYFGYMKYDAYIRSCCERGHFTESIALRCMEREVERHNNLLTIRAFVQEQI